MDQEAPKRPESYDERQARFAGEQLRDTELRYDSRVAQGLSKAAEHFKVDVALRQVAGGSPYVIRLYEPFQGRWMVPPSQIELTALRSVVERFQENELYRFIKEQCGAEQLTASLEVTTEKKSWPFAAIVITPEQQGV